MRLRKLLCILQIAFHLIYTSIGFYAFSFSVEAAESTISSQSDNISNNSEQKSVTVTPEADSTAKSSTENTLAAAAMQSGTMLQSDNSTDALKSMVVSGATSEATQNIESWLSQFGTARVKIATDNNFSLEDSALDVLIPLYDDKKENLLFTQVGARRADDRNIINAGIGYRYFADKWMAGTNLFYDYQISQNHHRRLGVGAELGWDYLKLSTNGYLRLSDWMASERFKDYDERAANGFDIRAEGYLPNFPQIGANIVYEQYFGDNVDLYNDEDNRQKDPYAVTLGVNYTPVPLITLGLDQKLGKGDYQDTQFNINLTYMPGVALNKQLDSEQVAQRHTLRGARQDLVNRNNEIVLEYRKQDMMSLALPERITGVENTTLAIAAKITGKYGVEHIDWQADELYKNGGKITATKTNGQYAVTLPHYQYNTLGNNYVVTGKAYDTKGNASNSSQMQVVVSGPDASTWHSTTTVNPASIPADGVATSTATVTIVSSDGQKITGVASRLSTELTLTPESTEKVSSGLKSTSHGTFSETSPGVYTSTRAGVTTSGSVNVQPFIDGTQALSNAKLTLVSGAKQAVLSSLTSSKTSALADAKDTITLTVEATLPDGSPYEGGAVSWSADNAQVLLSEQQNVTDANGIATMTISSHDVGSTTVTAQLDQSNALHSETLMFTGDNASAQVTAITASKSQVIADNSDQVTYTAQIVDADNHPLNGVVVKWKAESGNANLSAGESTSDEQGNATITVSSEKAGSVVISAQTGSSAAKSADTVVFSADSASMYVATLVADKDQALADGVDTITYTATVVDKAANPVAGETVNWVSLTSGTDLSDSVSTTDAQGVATMTAHSVVAGSSQVMAQTGSSVAVNAPLTTYIADSASAHFSPMIVDKSQAVADGTSNITLSTTLTDAKGNPLANVDVSWGVSPSTGTLSTVSTKTDAKGNVSVTLSSTVVADYVVTASFGSENAESSTLKFIADTTTAQIATLTADKTTNIVAAKDSVVLTATVKDAKGNLVPNATVNWTSDNGSGSFTSLPSITDANGVATANFSATKVQDTVITASIGTSSKTQSITMVADNTTATVSVSASKAQATADGVDSVTWSATVKDANSNLINGMSVGWTSDKTDVTLSGATSNTNASGLATISGTAQKAGDAIITATLTSPSVTASATKVSYIANINTAKVVAVTADLSTATANGAAAITLQTIVTDANGNVVPNASVAWSVSPTGGTLSAASTVTDAKGVATVTLKATTAGNYTVTAGINGVSVTSSTLTYTAEALTAVIDSLTATPKENVVAGKDSVALTATVKDANGNLVPNVTVSWVTNNGSGHFGSATSTTNASGVATTTFNATAVQNTDITVSIGSSSKTQSITMLADASTANVTVVTADKTQALANGSDPITLSTIVVDANNNPLIGANVDWSIAPTDGNLSAPTTMTDTLGRASVKLQSSKVNTYVVTAKINGKTAQSASLVYSADASTAQIATVTADKTANVVADKDNITLTATVKDADGNLVSGATVNWTSNNASGSFGSLSSVSNSSGVATTTYKAKVVQNTDIVASTGTSSKTQSITMVADNITATVSVSASKAQATADGADSVTWTATVKDANSNLINGMSVGWTSDKTDVTLSGATSNTNASGLATISGTAKKAGDAIITATLTSPSVKGSATKVSYIANINTAKLDTVTADKTKDVLANGAAFITLSTIVTDANGNVVPNASVAWSVSPTGGTLSAASTVTDTKGVATVTLKATTAGNYSVTAGINGVSVMSPTLTYIADVSTAVIDTFVAGKTAGVVAGANVALTATVKDAKGNLVPNATVNWTSNNGSGSFTLTGLTNASGVATANFSATKVQDTVITASIGTSSKTQSITMVADNTTATVSVSASKAQATADGADSVTWTATVKDANSNLINGMSVGWTSDKADVTLSGATSSTNTSGVATISGTAKKAGDAIITATLTSPSVKGSATKVSYIANINTAKVATVTADLSTATANGIAPVTLKTTVTDANDNVVSGASVTWSVLPATGASLANPTSTTGADGVATVTLTATTAGSYTVKAEINGTSATSSPLTYTADASTAVIDSLTATPEANVVAGANVALTATVKDAKGNLVPGATVNWKSDNTSGSFTLTGLTNASGVATANFSATKVQGTVITASIGTSSKTQSITMVADNTTATVSVSASKAQATADGVDSVTWTATVKDANSNPINGMSVGWTSDKTDVTLSGTTSSTNTSGVATISGTATTTADAIITATLTSPSVKGSATKVSFIGDVDTAKLLSVTVNKSTATANGVDAITLSTTVTDTNGNVVPDATVTWSASPATGTSLANPTTTKTGADGVATVTLTATKVNSYTVTAAINGTSALSPALTYTVDLTTLQVYTLTADKTTDVIAGKDTVTLTATVADATGNVVANEPVTWSDDNAGGTLTPASVNSDANGVVTATFTATKSQTTEISAKAASKGKTVSLTMNGDISTAQLSSITADKVQIVADGKEAITWSVTAVDANQNLIVNAGINWSSDNTDVLLTTAFGNTGADGKASISGTSLKSGVVTATATLSGQSATSDPASFIGDVRTATVKSVTPNKIAGVSDNSDTVTYTAIVLDANDNLLPAGIVVTWSASINNLSAASSTTDASGKATIQLHGLSGGLVTTTASTNGTNAVDSTVSFSGTYHADWDITGGSGIYDGAKVSGYSSLGFVVVAPTKGPTSLVWAEDGVSAITATLSDDAGNNYDVVFGGTRISNCSDRTFNSAVGCQPAAGSVGVMGGRLLYDASQNSSLPKGVYTGHIYFKGVQWGGTPPYTSDFDVVVKLTVD